MISIRSSPCYFLILLMLQVEECDGAKLSLNCPQGTKVSSVCVTFFGWATLLLLQLIVSDFHPVSPLWDTVKQSAWLHRISRERVPLLRSLVPSSCRGSVPPKAKLFPRRVPLHVPSRKIWSVFQRHVRKLCSLTLFPESNTTRN